MTSPTGSTSTTTGTASPRSGTCSIHTKIATLTRSSTTRARSPRSTARTGTGGSSTPSRASTDAHAACRRCSAEGLGRLRARRATSGCARRPNYPALAQAAVHTLRAATPCSPGSATRASRRSRGDLRPRRPTPVPAPAPDPERGRHGRRRPRNRSTSTRSRCRSRSRAHRGRSTTDQRDVSRSAVIGVWSGGEPPQGAHPRRRRLATRSGGAVGPGLAPGQPAVQRGHRPDGSEGPLERAASRRTSGVRPQVQQPELAGLLPVLYPGVFPNLAGMTAPRADLVAILLTGFPPGSSPGSRTTPATGRSAAAQRRDPADDGARTRSGCSAVTRRLPQRAARVRRRRQHRAAGDRRRHDTRSSTRRTRPTRRRRCSPRV